MARRALAAPFVVTISLSAMPACDSSKTEIADAEKADAKTPEPKKPEPERVHKNPPALPPEPVPEDSKNDTKDDTKDETNEAAPPKPEEVDPFKPPKNRITEGKETTQLQPDGTCMKHVDTTCAPGKHCNPPPPKAVKCPKDLRLPKAAKGAEIYQRPDRTCWQKGKEDCPEGEACPPPPSTRVVCPEGMTTAK